MSKLFSDNEKQAAGGRQGWQRPGELQEIAKATTCLVQPLESLVSTVAGRVGYEGPNSNGLPTAPGFNQGGGE